MDPEPVPASSHFLSRPNAHRDQDEADILGIQDLRIAFQVEQQVGQRGLEQEKRRAKMAEDLCSPGQADQVVMLENAAMGMKIPAWLEGEDKALVPQADQLNQVAGLCVSRCGVPGHGAILPVLPSPTASLLLSRWKRKMEGGCRLQI